MQHSTTTVAGILRVLKRRQFTSFVVVNIRNVVFVLFCDRMVYGQFFHKSS